MNSVCFPQQEMLVQVQSPTKGQYNSWLSDDELLDDDDDDDDDYDDDAAV